MAKKIKKLVLLVVAVMVFAFCGIFLTACGKPGDVSVSSIVYDGETIKWGKAKNATSYVLTVDGKAITLGTTEYAYKAKSSTKSVEVSVYALGKGDKQGAKASKTFTRLDTIRKEAITFSADGVMSWEEVEDADKYELEINGNVVSTASLEWDEFEYGKTNKIRIRPVTNNNTTFSSWSSAISKIYLGVPTNITYDGVTLRWKGSMSAEGYNIYIDGNLAFEGVSGTSYGYDAEQQSFDVSLQAVGNNVENGDKFSSPIGEEQSFTFLPVITRDAMEVDSGVLTWETVEEATAYQLEINGTVQSQVQKETSYEIPAGTQMRIRVKPVLQEGNVYFSDFSEEIDVYLLNTPSPEWNNFTLEDGEAANVIDWSDVSGEVGGYTVKIVLPDGTEQYEEFPEKQREFLYAFVDAGKYQLSVKATAGDVDVYDSKFSTPFEITRLPSPTALATNSVTSDSTDLARGFTWTWQNVYGASGYQIYKEGNPINALSTDRAYSKTVTNVIDESVTEETEITYTVQSLGSVSDHTIFLPSIINPDKAIVLTQKITVQAMPRDLTFDGFDMTWTGTSNAQKYAIRHSGNSNPATATMEKYDMQTLNAGTYQLSVCTQGNGGAVLASNYTEQKTVERLQRPYELKIGTRVQEGYLQWVGDKNAESYIITIRGGSEPIETKSSINVADKISTTGTALGVTAKANYLTKDGTTYYLTSEESEVKTFKKLDAPKFNEAKVQNGKLVWNAPTNAAKFTPSYQLAMGSGMTYDGYISGREFTLAEEEFPAGKYQLKVKAIGDSEEFINSDFSETASFTILDTPDVKLGKTAYEWEGVSEAISYQVKVNNEIRADIRANAGVNDKFSWTPDNFTEIGTYDVKIVAIGDGGKTLVDSYPYERIQETKRLSVPTITLGYSEADNRYTENGEVVVTVTQKVPFANGYGYIINGSKHEKGEDVLSFSMDPNTTGDIPVSVYAIGGQFDDAGVYRLSSPETTSPKKITILHAPSSETIEVTTSLVKWAYIDGALGYEVEITFTGNVTKTIMIENGSDAYVMKSQITALGYTLKDIRKVRVSALGSKSANSVSSGFAERPFSS